MVGGVTYKRATAAGLVIGEEGKDGERLLEVDTIVVCTGQTPMRGLYDALVAKGVSIHLIGTLACLCWLSVFLYIADARAVKAAHTRPRS